MSQRPRAPAVSASTVTVTTASRANREPKKQGLLPVDSNTSPLVVVSPTNCPSSEPPSQSNASGNTSVSLAFTPKTEQVVNGGEETADAAMPDAASSPPVKKKRKSPAVPWKKPKDMPKRPLSAYNLFFQQERTRIVNTESNTVGFESMAKAIAAKWRSLDAPTKAPFEEQAAANKKEYQVKVTAWRAKQKEKKRIEKEAAAHAAAVKAASPFPERHSSFQENYEPSFMFQPSYSSGVTSQPSRSSSSLLDEYPLEWFEASEASDYEPQESAFGRHTMMPYETGGSSSGAVLRGPDISGGMIEMDPSISHHYQQQQQQHRGSLPSTGSGSSHSSSAAQSSIALPQAPNIWTNALDHPSSTRSLMPPTRGRSVRGRTSSRRHHGTSRGSSNSSGGNLSGSSSGTESSSFSQMARVAHIHRMRQEVVQVEQQLEDLKRRGEQEDLMMMMPPPPSSHMVPSRTRGSDYLKEEAAYDLDHQQQPMHSPHHQLQHPHHHHQQHHQYHNQQARQEHHPDDRWDHFQHQQHYQDSTAAGSYPEDPSERDHDRKLPPSLHGYPSGSGGGEMAAMPSGGGGQQPSGHSDDRFAPIPLSPSPYQRRRMTLGRFPTTGSLDHESRGVPRRWSTPHEVHPPTAMHAGQQQQQDQHEATPTPPQLPLSPGAHADADLRESSRSLKRPASSSADTTPEGPTLPQEPVSPSAGSEMTEIPVEAAAAEAEVNGENTLEILKEDLDDDAMEYLATLKFDE